MTSIQIPTTEAYKLAKIAIASYKARAASLPVLSPEHCQGLAQMIHTGKSGGIDVSDKQINDARTELTGENIRRGLVAAIERAEGLSEFFSLKNENAFLGVYVQLSFEDWVFMTKSKTLEVQ